MNALRKLLLCVMDMSEQLKYKPTCRSANNKRLRLFCVEKKVYGQMEQQTELSTLLSEVGNNENELMGNWRRDITPVHENYMSVG